jgi:hypothetical protein
LSAAAGKDVFLGGAVRVSSRASVPISGSNKVRSVEAPGVTHVKYRVVK